MRQRFDNIIIDRLWYYDIVVAGDGEHAFDRVERHENYVLPAITYNRF